MKKRRNDKSTLRAMLDASYSSERLRRLGKPAADPEEFAAREESLSACKEEVRRDPLDGDALLRLKAELTEYKRMYIRLRMKLKNKRNKPKKLAELLKAISIDAVLDRIAEAELAQYNEFFERHATITRPAVKRLINAKNFHNRLRTESLVDIYKSVYTADTVRLRIEQSLLENPKELYPAARAMRRRFIIHSGMTNTGKTYNAINALKKAETGAYLGPLRLLAMEIQENLLIDDVMCSLKTGEEEDIVRYATHVASTVEMVNLYAFYDTVVIDECQMIGDRHRGCAWTRAILGVRAPEIHLCTAPDAVDILTKLITDCGDSYEIIEYERRTPILYDASLEKPDADKTPWDRRKPTCAERLERIDLDKLQYGDALIAFSRSDVLEIAEILRGRGIETSVVYGALPYSARKRQLERFIRRETSVIVATDAIGMGLNLPIRRVIFTVAHKFDGEHYRLLKPAEIKQIAGRAGRKGIYDEGLVFSAEEAEYITSALTAEYEPIRKAYIDFDTAFLDIEYEMKEILKAWTLAELPFDIYEKIDVRRELRLLRHIERLCAQKHFECDKETAYRLATIAFDDGDGAVFGRWLDYSEEYLGGKDELSVPRISTRSIEKLETSYKKVDLYFAFCRAMDYEPNEEWVEKIRGMLSEEINGRLNKQKKNRASS